MNSLKHPHKLDYMPVKRSLKFGHLSVLSTPYFPSHHIMKANSILSIIEAMISKLGVATCLKNKICGSINPLTYTNLRTYYTNISQCNFILDNFAIIKHPTNSSINSS